MSGQQYMHSNDINHNDVLICLSLQWYIATKMFMPVNAVQHTNGWCAESSCK